MTNNCPNCDKPGCQAASLDALYQAIDPWRRPADLAHKRGAAIALCGANRVDWRARALTEAARADSAEARIAEVEAVARRLADFFDRQPSDYRLGLRHGAQRAVEGLASQIGEPKP